MKIAVIGAGFTGLSAAFELSKNGHEVIVFEKNHYPGGLAVGFKEKPWKWSLEKHYHHLFTNDKEILKLAKEINHPLILKRPKTAIYINKNTYQLDSPFNMLNFPLLNILERLRMGFSIAFFRFFPFWKPLEKYNAVKLLPKIMGKKGYKIIWEPLFLNKFGKYANNISLAWFWARIVKRTPSLYYPFGGFSELANSITKKIISNGGKIYFDTEIIKISSRKAPNVEYKKNSQTKLLSENFDKIIITVPSYAFLKITPDLPQNYKNELLKLKSLGATNLILRLKKPFFKDHTYWLNICNKNNPVMAIVEHTNLIGKENYNNEHIIYLGNYKSREDSFFSLNKEEMLSLFDPFLKTINPAYHKNIIGIELFKDPFAQPIIPINYSKLVPQRETPLKNVYLANIDQVYPWDRGTNYAIELGKIAAEAIFK